ncbi:Taxilin family [Trinorchestia longiramus]|nr:Taxilin family [Trinorchestia longiramus]
MAGNNKKTSKSTKTKGSKGGGDGGAEAVINAIKSMPADQQIVAFTSKLAEIMAQNEQLKSSLNTSISRCEAAEKSNNQLNSDYTKAMLSKGQLESLCRELQKQNKLTKEENLARVREEEEKRRELSARLNTTLSDITGLLEQNKEKNTELRQDNQNMATRLNDLVTQYSERQENIDKILKQRDLQLQLAEAKLAKASIEASEERETFLQDKKKMLEEMQMYQEKLTRMATIEITLRTQLSSYSEQYEKFEKTAHASNTIINKFKKEMESMAKKMKKLEKETLSWQTKCAKSNATLLEMLTERASHLTKIERLTKQNDKLQQLARGMQAQLVQERQSRREAAVDADGAAALAEKVEKAIEEACTVVEEPCEALADSKLESTKEVSAVSTAGESDTLDRAESKADDEDAQADNSESGENFELADLDSSAATIQLTEIATQLTEISSELSTLTGKKIAAAGEAVSAETPGKRTDTEASNVPDSNSATNFEAEIEGVGTNTSAVTSNAEASLSISANEGIGAGTAALVSTDAVTAAAAAADDDSAAAAVIESVTDADESATAAAIESTTAAAIESATAAAIDDATAAAESNTCAVDSPVDPVQITEL